MPFTNDPYDPFIVDDRWCACCGLQDDNPRCCQNLTEEQNEARLIETGLLRPPAEPDSQPLAHIDAQWGVPDQTQWHPPTETEERA